MTRIVKFEHIYFVYLDGVSLELTFSDYILQWSKEMPKESI